MKQFAFIIVGLSLLLSSCKSSNDPEEIALIAELPDTKEYMVDGKYVDIGIVYKTVIRENVSFRNYDKRWCLFNGTTYWKMDKSKLDEIAQQAGITLQANTDLPFWVEWGLWIIMIVCVIVGLLGFWIWSKIQPKVKALKPQNPNLNNQNAAKLIFDGHYKIKTYNGTDVKWSTILAKTVSVLLPPGECSLVFDFKEKEDADTTNVAKNHTVKNIVEAGKTYYLKSYLWCSIMSTYIEEGKDKDKKDYLSSTGVMKASWTITRVGENFTPDTAKQFINDFLKRKKNKGYRIVDEREKALALFNKFRKFPITLLEGEVYSYREKNWILLISTHYTLLLSNL
jgi:hypothetical protein